MALWRVEMGTAVTLTVDVVNLVAAFPDEAAFHGTDEEAFVREVVDSVTTEELAALAAEVDSFETGPFVELKAE